MKKTVLVTSAIILFLAGSFAFTGKNEDPQYKNLKILPKNITHEQMDSVMHHFTASLNVKCNFCHVRDTVKKEMNWAADDNKHKLIARKMMMITNKLNDKYFDYTGGKAKELSTQLMVTCYTCHHGSTEPATKAPRMERREQRPPQDSARKVQ